MKEPSKEIILPAKGLFSKAELGFIDQGFWRGSLALVLDLAKDPKPLSAKEAPALFQVLLQERSNLDALRIVRLRGRLFDESVEPAQASLGGLLALFLKYDFRVQIETPVGPCVPMWLEECSWIVVKTPVSTSLRTVNEIWYSPEDEAPLEDLSLGGLGQLWDKREHFYYITKSRRLEELLDFMAKSPAHWALL
jgi:hypothetical protein